MCRAWFQVLVTLHAKHTFLVCEHPREGYDFILAPIQEGESVPRQIHKHSFLPVQHYTCCSCKCKMF